MAFRPRWLFVSLALAGSSLGCQRSGVSEGSPTVAVSDSPSASGPSERVDVGGDNQAGAGESSSPEPGPRLEPIYDQLIARVTDGAAPTAESESMAWTHYKAKDYEQAQLAFALASLHEREAWKHPFNLACVSARLQDEGMVRVALTEAMARDAEATVAKARDDGDLSAYRNAPWWEATMGPKPARSESDDELEIQSAAELAGPKLAEPSILPAGRNTAIAPDRLEAVRAKLFEVHGLYPQIRGSLEFRNPIENENENEIEGEGGAMHGYVIYDYPVLDGCMLERHKKVCLARWGEDLEAGGGWDMSHCVHAYIARASFPTEDGAELEADVRALSFGCGPANVYRLDLVDADGDGADEVVIDIRSHAVVLGRRYTKDYISGRVFEVHRLDGTPQFAFKHDLRTFSIIDTSVLFRRVVAKDVNQDGTIDFVIQSREVDANVRYPVDAELWPVLADKRYEVVGELKTEVRHYKPSQDRW